MVHIGTFGNRLYTYLRQSHKPGDTVIVHIGGDPEYIEPAIVLSIIPARTTGFNVTLILPNTAPNFVEFTQHMHLHESFEYFFSNETHRTIKAKVLMGLGEKASLSDLEAKKEAMYDPLIAYNVEYTKDGIKTRNAFHKRC